MRRILVAVLLWMLVPTVSASVSLGEIDVRSFLNQPLDARITAAGTALAAGTVEFRLAPEEDYRRAGLMRGALPPDLEIRVEGSGATRVVRLSTQRPVREPYLGVLIEARWGAGRILREYTLLLDPPVAFAPEAAAPPVVTRPAERAPFAARPVEPVQPGPAVATTYRVRRGDTLMTIVRQQNYVGVTSEQAMLAILEANPQAFIGGNINQLRSEAVLALPSQDEVAARDPEAARAEVRRQTQVWREQTAPRPAPPPPPAAPAAPPEPAQPRTAPPEPGTPGTPPTGEDPLRAEVEPEVLVQDRLEILGGPDGAGGGLIGAGSSLVLEEAMLSQQTAMTELRQELIALRAEIEERDQLLAVVNTELAQLERRMRELQLQARGPDAIEGMALHERILADPLLLLMAGTMVLLLLLLLVSVMRPMRTRVAEIPVGGNAPARTAATPAVDAPTPQNRATHAAAGAAMAGSASGAAAATAVSQTAGSEPSGSGASQQLPSAEIDVDEGRDDDVLADVDLYLAYGMNDQAISALNKAIEDGTDTVEYRMRLLEAHAANNDAQMVKVTGAALRERLGPADDALRARIAELEESVGVLESSAESAGADAPDRTGHGGGAESAQPDAAPAAREQDPGVMEFEAIAIPDSSDEDTRSTGSKDDDDPNLLRFDLDGIDEFAATQTPQAQPAKADEGAGAALLDLPDLTLPDDASTEGGERKAEAQRDDSTHDDTSENGMKISLAEAFADMGDRDGALALLEEIMPTATEQQKQRVEEIRRQIDAPDAG